MSDCVYAGQVLGFFFFFFPKVLIKHHMKWNVCAVKPDLADLAVCLGTGVGVL